MLTTRFPPVLEEAGLDAAALGRVDHLMVGCGGFVKELIAFTAGATTVKGGSSERVSAADRLVEALLIRELTAVVPGSSGYSEECGAFGAARSRVRWLIDPVDGTRPATLGGAFGVCAAAVVFEGDSPAAAVGWVYVPPLSALYRGVLAPEHRECLLNGRPVSAAAPSGPDLPGHYLAVSSDWRSDRLPGSTLKLSAPGATAVHLTQLVQPGSDVAAAALTRYRSYDAAAGVLVAAAGGCEIYPLDGDGALGVSRVEPLRFVAEGGTRPDAYGPPVLVCHPSVVEALRAAAAAGPGG